jgi:hypothetical protein
MPLIIKQIPPSLNISPSFILYLFFDVGYFSPLNISQVKLSLLSSDKLSIFSNLFGI